MYAALWTCHDLAHVAGRLTLHLDVLLSGPSISSSLKNCLACADLKSHKPGLGSMKEASS